MGVDVNFEDVKNILFIVVCIKGYLNVLEELIIVGVDVNLEDIKNILFIIVCIWGYFNVV